MRLLDVRPDHLKIVLDILQKHIPKNEVWAFGSRAKWTAKEYSDLDLCIISSAPLSFSLLGALADDFTDSNLPYKVDVVDWATVSESFREILKQDRVVVQQPSKKGGMSLGWEKVVFGDLVEVVSDRDKAKSSSFSSYVSTENMEPNFGGVSPPATLPTGGNVTKFKIGDILFSNIRTYFRKVWQAKFDGHCSNDVLVFRPKDHKTLHPSYLHNLCRWDRFTEFSVRTSKGAKMPRGDKDAILQFQFEKPPPPIQHRISSILEAFDDRIALLRETNSTLEAIAQALFKSWFVDFDPVRAKQEGRQPEGMDEATAALFPDSFEESELGLVPRGWGIRAVYDMASYINGAAYKAFEPNVNKRGLPIIKIAELKTGVTENTAFSDIKMPDKYLIQPSDILFSWSGNPDTSIDTFVWTHDAAWLNQHIFRVVPNQPNERSFVLQALKNLRPIFAELARNKQTTGLGHVTVSDLKRLLIVKPSQAVIDAFEQVVGSLQQHIFQNELQVSTLSNLRDTLLPRLISGRLRIDVGAGPRACPDTQSNDAGQPQGVAPTDSSSMGAGLSRNIHDL